MQLDSAGYDLDQSIARTVPEEKYNALLTRYDTLRRYYNLVQSKFRKEKDIWKKWIVHINDREAQGVDLGLAPTSERLIESDHELQTPRARSNNVSHDSKPPATQVEQRFAQPEHTMTRHGQISDKQSHRVRDVRETSPSEPFIKQENSPEGTMLVSSSQDACSIDLDQVTVRKSVVTRPVSTEDAAESTNHSPTPNFKVGGDESAKHSLVIKSLFGEDCSSQAHQSLEHQSSVLDNMLRTVPDNIPGKRSRESPSYPSSRDLKRTKSESCTQAVARSNTIHKRDNLGKGRYASGLGTAQAVSMMDYAINRDTNDGYKYAFHEVVRGREARKHLEAEDCSCCSKFYKLAGPVPSTRAPVWGCPESEGQDKENKSENDIHGTTKQQVSRHRTNWRRSPTPPEFWNCDFPTTQELEREKKDNQERRQRKIQAMEKEAGLKGGRYVKRSERVSEA